MPEFFQKIRVELQFEHVAATLVFPLGPSFFNWRLEISTRSKDPSKLNRYKPGDVFRPSLGSVNVYEGQWNIRVNGLCLFFESKSFFPSDNDSVNGLVVGGLYTNYKYPMFIPKVCRKFLLKKRRVLQFGRRIAGFVSRDEPVPRFTQPTTEFHGFHVFSSLKIEGKDCSISIYDDFGPILLRISIRFWDFILDLNVVHVEPWVWRRFRNMFKHVNPQRLAWQGLNFTNFMRSS